MVFDSIYGNEDIGEGVLVDLINSEPLQRLKKISQWGIPDKYNHMKNGFSRYEHSIGVLILLKRFGADLKEQIAGLLHDVSHTAFSHVIDWVIGNPEKEDFQDRSYLEFIVNSEIPKVLEKHNFNYKDFVSLSNFRLLEREIPDLCADRVDYFLREIYLEDKSIVKKALDNLIIVNGNFVFKDKNIAEAVSVKYLEKQKNHWASPLARARYFVLSEALKISLNKGIVSLDDFYKTDNEVIEILEQSNDNRVLHLLDLLKGNLNIAESSGSKGFYLPKKKRFIDPFVFSNSSVIRLSKVSKDYKDLLDYEDKVFNIDKKIIIEGLEI